MGYLHPARRKDALCHTVLTCSVPCIASEWTLWPLASLVLSVTGFPITKEEWQHRYVMVMPLKSRATGVMRNEFSADCLLCSEAEQGTSLMIYHLCSNAARYLSPLLAQTEGTRFAQCVSVTEKSDLHRPQDSLIAAEARKG